MKKLYATTVTSTGGRNGHVSSADNALDADVRLPKSMGGAEGNFLNPETFFAAGYAACFNSALERVSSLEKLTVAPIVVAEVDLLQLDDSSFILAVKLTIEIPGVDHEKAVELANKAHAVCPYSNATRGNIEVVLTIK
jgi:Ohr subfamily peroxiredoxin